MQRVGASVTPLTELIPKVSSATDQRVLASFRGIAMIEGVFTHFPLDGVVQNAALGSHSASKELVERMWPTWQRLVRRSPALRAVVGNDDDVTNIVLTLIEKITPPDGRALASYPSWQARYPEKQFDDWMRIVTANAVRDYVRALKRRPRTHLSLDLSMSSTRLLNEFLRSSVSHQLSTRPPYTSKETVRQLLEFASQHLKETQVRALDLWLEGTDFQDMGRELGCDAASSRRHLRAALAQLRRKFAL